MGIFCIDLLDEFREAHESNFDNLFFRVDPHLNVSGNTLAAEVLHRYLVDYLSQNQSGRLH